MGTALGLCVLCKAAQISPWLSLLVWEGFVTQWEENTNFHIMPWLLFIFLLPKWRSMLALAVKMNLWEINFEAVVLGKQCLIQTCLISSSFAFVFKPCDYRWKWEKVNPAPVPVCVLLYREEWKQLMEAVHSTPKSRMIFFFFLTF